MKEFSVLYNIQTCSVAHIASYLMGTAAVSIGSMIRAWNCYSHPSSSNDKNVWSYTTAPSYVWMEWSLIMYKKNFTKYSGSIMWSLKKDDQKHKNLVFFFIFTACILLCFTSKYKVRFLSTQQSDYTINQYSDWNFYYCNMFQSSSDHHQAIIMIETIKLIETL
jgi:hypothetical protein